MESPSNSTKIHGEFSRDEGGDIIVQGFINVKDKEFGWLPIYPWKRLDDRYFHPFGYNESVVTCREGGYNSGSFISHQVNDNSGIEDDNGGMHDDNHGINHENRCINEDN